MPTLLQTLVLAIIQAATELLPVSSSAHVIVAEKLMGINPSTPETVFLLVTLHTGTTAAVLCYFWKEWREKLFRSNSSKNKLRILTAINSSREENFVRLVLMATAATLAVGFVLKITIENFILPFLGKEPRIELLFSFIPLIASSLFAAGVLIFVSSRFSKIPVSEKLISTRVAIFTGALQGLCLPFRGFSRSGATISFGMLCGVEKRRAESFSFALSVALTPLIIIRQGFHLLKMSSVESMQLSWGGPVALGLVTSFLAGLIALRFLSHLLENEKWHLFSYYCFAASLSLWLLHWNGALT